MSTSSAQQLGTLLQQQIESAAQLLQILQNENAVLVKRDFEKIQHLSQQKSEQSATLEQLVQQQHQLLQERGCSSDSSEGLNSFIGSQPQNIATQLSKKRQKLQAILESCQKLNQVNGNIIAVNKHSAETALAILRGQFTSDNLVYSADGQTVTAPSSKPSVKV